MWKCGKCGCKIVNPDIPMEKWLNVSSNNGFSDKAKNSSLMYVTNSNPKEKNVWICKKCFGEFCELYHSKDGTVNRFKWFEAWTEFIGTGLKFAFTQHGQETFVLS